MLRDRLVCGIRDGRVQRRLLAESDLKFKKAFELSQAEEVAERSAKDLQKSNVGSVQTLQRQPSNPVLSEPIVRNCYRCGGTHAPDTCRFRETECYLCPKKGHLARVRRSKAEQQAAPGPHQRCRGRGDRDRKSNMHTLQVEEEGGADPTYTLFHVRGEDSMSEPVTETMVVNGANLEMEVDTGAACSVISAMTYQESWPKDQAPPLYSTKKKLCTYTGEPLQIKGDITVRACYQAQTAELELLVVAGTGPSLLG